MSGLVARRQAIRDDFLEREGINITYLPFVMKAVAESLKESPLLQFIMGRRRDPVQTEDQHWHRCRCAGWPCRAGGTRRRHDEYRWSCAKDRRPNGTRARRGQLRLDDVQGGTFTLNNTGVLGSVVSQPLVNFPQAAILTTEAIVKRPVVVGDGIAIRSMMNLCMSFDHRIMDGAEASAFINSVKRRLESIGPDTGVY